MKRLFAVASLLAVVACGGEAASPSVADASIKTGRAKLRRCYQEAFAANPNPEGRIVVRVVVAADGSVLSADVAERSGNLPEATVQCVVDAARVFPWESSGRTDVRNVSFRMQKER